MIREEGGLVDVNPSTPQALAWEKRELEHALVIESNSRVLNLTPAG